MTIEYKNGRVISSGNVPEGLIYIKEYYDDGENYNGCRLFGFLSIESTYNMWGELIKRETIREQRSYFGKNEYHCLLDVTIGERTYTARKVLKMTANEWKDENYKSFHYTQQSFSDNEFDYYRSLISDYIDGYHDYSSGVEISWEDDVIVNHDGYANGFQEKYYSTLKRVDFGTHIEWASRNIEGYYSPSEIHRLARDGWRIPTRYEFEELLHNSRITFSSNFKCGYCNIEHTSGWGGQVVLTLEAAKHNGWWIADDDVRAEQHVGYYLVNNPGGSPQVLRICDNPGNGISFIPAKQSETYSVILVKDKHALRNEIASSSINSHTVKSLHWYDLMEFPNSKVPYFQVQREGRYYFLNKDLNEFPRSGLEGVLYAEKDGNNLRYVDPKHTYDWRRIQDINPWVKVNGKWGKYDWERQTFEIIPQYDNPPVISYNYETNNEEVDRILAIDGKFGIVENGAIILSFIFDEISRIHNDLYACRRNGKWDIYSFSKKEFILSGLGSIESMASRLFKVEKDDQFGVFYAKTQNMYLDIEYDDIEYVGETYFIICDCGYYGVFDYSKGEYILDHKYESIKSYEVSRTNDRVFVAREDGYYGIFSAKRNSFILDTVYDEITIPENSSASYAILKQLTERDGDTVYVYGMFDIPSEIIFVDVAFDNIELISGKYATLEYQHAIGLVDLYTKRIIIECRTVFESIEVNGGDIYVSYCGNKVKYVEGQIPDLMKGFPLLPGINQIGRKPEIVLDYNNIPLSAVLRNSAFTIHQGDMIRIPEHCLVIRQKVKNEDLSPYCYYLAVERNGKPSWLGLGVLLIRDYKNQPIDDFRTKILQMDSLKAVIEYISGKKLYGGSYIVIKKYIVDSSGMPTSELRERSIPTIEMK